MLSDFFKDMNSAKAGERIVKEALIQLKPDYVFKDVSNDRYYYHKGDIRAIDKNGKETLIEVKQDSRIAETGNVLCEDMVYFNDSGYKSGNMHSDYEIYCVVSQTDTKIYVIDFSILKQIYKKGRYKIIPHTEQTTYCYLLPLTQIQECGGLLGTINYSEMNIS